LAAGARVDPDLEHPAVGTEQADPVLDAVAVALLLGADGARVVAPLRLRDRLVERNGPVRESRLAAAPTPAVARDGIAGQDGARRQGGTIVRVGSIRVIGIPSF
jgi:hypothetical protein